MIKKLVLHPDRLFSSDENIRQVARVLYQKVKDLPIISPHGHTDPSWFSKNLAFENATELLIKPDHCISHVIQSGHFFRKFGYRNDLILSRLSAINPSLLRVL